MLIYYTDDKVHDAVENCEQKIGLALTAEQDGVLSEDEMQKLYDDAITALDDLIELMNNPTSVYFFFKMKAVLTILKPHFSKHNELTSRLLILMKTLFSIAPTTSSSMMPIKFVDRLLDIFDSDAHMGLRVHSLDILALWLPGNPKVQARVMKLKGLEPFYKEIDKFDSSVIRTLLTLFNDILSEHLAARKDDALKPTDTKKLDIYKKIGLLERAETSTFCNGLLNIFENIWSYSVIHDDIVLPVFDLTKNLKQFCLYKFNDRGKAMELFQDFMKHVIKLKDKESKVFNMDKLLVYEEVLNDYIDKLKTVKDEF